MTAPKKSEQAAPWAKPPIIPADPPASVPIENPFGSPKASANPFKAPPPVVIEETEPEARTIPEDTPSWGDFVRFITLHGNQLIMAEYPLPKGDVVETMWAGIPVRDGDSARLRHKVAGWVDWETATSE